MFYTLLTSMQLDKTKTLLENLIWASSFLSFLVFFCIEKQGICSQFLKSLLSNAERVP